MSFFGVDEVGEYVYGKPDQCDGFGVHHDNGVSDPRLPGCVLSVVWCRPYRGLVLSGLTGPCVVWCGIDCVLCGA